MTTIKTLLGDFKRIRLGSSARDRLARANRNRRRIVAEISYEQLDEIEQFLEGYGYSFIRISPLFEGTIYGAFRTR